MGDHSTGPGAQAREINPLLPVDSDIYEKLTSVQLKEIKAVQLQYAIDVTTAAATAYAAIKVIVA